MKTPRIIAILSTYNERRFIEATLQHHTAQGLEVYLVDNESTDETVKLAERFLGRGLVGIETWPRGETVHWGGLMERKEQLAATLDADWFVHLDCDEFRFSQRHRTLAEGISELDAAGYNAVNFIEFTFIPTIEDPDHDHPSFQQTMRSYYPFLPSFPHRLNAWKRQPGPVDLRWSAGHVVRFTDLRMAPESFSMRHYQVLSVRHAVEKYGNRRYASEDIERGWHGWRNRLDPARITLPSSRELRAYVSDETLDASDPRTKHYAAAWGSTV